MKILDDLVSDLDLDTSVKDIRQGVFHTGVLTRNCGLAATLPKDALGRKPPLTTKPGSLLELNPIELAKMAYSERILEASIGMAAINSLLEIKTENYLELNAGDLISDRGKDKNVAIVGHFPFIPEIREKAKKLWVIEKNPQEGDLSEDEAERIIPQADVIGITGTAFTNNTLENLLGLCNPKAFVVILGDTTPLSPILFDYGVDAISGTKVMDNDLVLKCVSQGANYRQIKGIKKLTLMK